VFGTNIGAERNRIAPIYSQLEPFKNRRAGALSGGMKQKLALCCALVHRPEILFLDEPTTGVDAVSRREFWDLLGELKAGGLTAVVSTPYMDEADRCDRIALIQRGRLLAIDTPETVARSFDHPLMAVRSDNRHDALIALRAYPHAGTAYPFGASIHFTDRRAEVPAERQQTELRSFLESRGLTNLTVDMTTPTVEDTFMARMGDPTNPESPS
jgi:drug efflux transport system ATP-binding protein